MSSFLHKFFSDPIVGLLAVAGISFVGYLGWADFKERTERRQAEKRRTKY